MVAAAGEAQILGSMGEVSMGVDSMGEEFKGWILWVRNLRGGFYG